jgi:hypothetical protein
MPTTLSSIIIALVMLACAMLVILALASAATALPGWLPYLLIGLLGLGFYLHKHSA